MHCGVSWKVLDNYFMHRDAESPYSNGDLVYFGLSAKVDTFVTN
jgi:hypothetical protein